MRDLSKLGIKSQEIEIEGEKFKIYGLTVPELAKFASLVDKQGSENGVSYLLKTSMRKAITKEELPDDKFNEFIDTLSSQVGLKVINVVKTLSGLDQEAPTEKK